MTEAIGNVQTVYYMTNDKDSSLVGLNYLETDTMRMYLGAARKLDKSGPISLPVPCIRLPRFRLPSISYLTLHGLRTSDQRIRMIFCMAWQVEWHGVEIHQAP